MIERNDSLDRRILLEAQALIEDGWVVTVLHGGAQDGPATSNGLKHIRVPLNRTPFDGDGESKLKKLWLLFKFVLVSPEKVPGIIEDTNALSARTIVWLELLTSLLHPRYFGEIEGSGAVFRKIASVFRSCFKDGSEVLEPWSGRAFQLLEGYGPFDVVHAHDLPSLPLGLALKKRMTSSSRSARLYYDSHELFPYQTHFSKAARKKFLNLEKKLIPQCDAMIVVTPDHRKLLDLTSGTKFLYLPNATEVAEGLDSSRQNLREVLRLAPTAKIVVFQGILTSNRNILQLIEGMRFVSDSVHLVLITWPSEHRRVLPLIQSLNLTTRVHLFGPVGWESIGNWITSADVGIIPYQPVDLNSKYCLPNKLFEFIAHKVPVIANANLHSVANLVEANGFGLCRALVEPEDYGAAITEFFERDLRDGYVKNLEANSERFTWNKFSLDLISLYRNEVAQ